MAGVTAANRISGFRAAAAADSDGRKPISGAGQLRTMPRFFSLSPLAGRGSG
jgi:hypothetical protein